MAHLTAPAEPGQFDDSPGDQSNGLVNRDGEAYIDTFQFDEDEVSDDDDDDEDFEDEIDDGYDENRVEDEDWEVAERDFTKQFNRLRQHVAVRTGNAQGVASAVTTGTSIASLPVINKPRPGPSQSASKTPATKDRTIDQLTAFSSKYNSRLAKLDKPYILGVGVNRKGPSAHANIKDKSDRATNEQVLDPRTRLILFKMIGRGLIHEVNGCISTGKEANVYHALTPEGKHLALKIYKTSILVFKDRDKYVTGEYRFRRGYSRRNPRKMVRLWAEKELRNLKRLVATGIRCPDPVEVRENVLVMTFLGDDEGWASPRLKDASLPATSLDALYVELILIVRRLFHRCKLVHADLSEYNILYHQDHLYIIDVSQSVEHDHPSAFDFLRNDIKNVEEFFGRLGVRCLGLRKCFEFVTRERPVPGEELPQTVEGLDKLEEEALLECLREQGDTQDNASASDSAQDAGAAAHEDSVFLRSFIPRTLNEVYDPERDVEKLSKGQGDDLIYADTIGLVKPFSGLPIKDQGQGEQEFGGGQAGMDAAGSTAPLASIASPKVQARTPSDVVGEELVDQKSSLLDAEVKSGGVDRNAVESQNESPNEEVTADEEEDSDEEGQDGGWVEKKSRDSRPEDKEAKKERKKAVKAEARERRKNKIPKAEKKRLMKRSKA